MTKINSPAHVMQVLPMQRQFQGPGEITVDGTPPVTTPPQQTQQEQQQSQGDRYFSSEDIEKARREEKEKLYGRLSSLQEQLDVFNKEREEQAQLAAAQAAKEEEERKAREREELSAKELLMKTEDEFSQKLNSAQQEWENRIKQLEEENNAQKAILEQERRFQELTSYKNRRIQEESTNLMPELLDMISGNTEDEIEQSIRLVAEKTANILSQIQSAVPQRPGVKGVPATGSSPSGPLENMTEYQTVTDADIRNMSLEEYAKVRERLLASASRR
jgi:hypothetical protein